MFSLNGRSLKRLSHGSCNTTMRIICLGEAVVTVESRKWGYKNHEIPTAHVLPRSRCCACFEMPSSETCDRAFETTILHSLGILIRSTHPECPSWMCTNTLEGNTVCFASPNNPLVPFLDPLKHEFATVLSRNKGKHTVP